MPGLRRLSSVLKTHTVQLCIAPVVTCWMPGLHHNPLFCLFGLFLSKLFVFFQCCLSRVHFSLLPRCLSHSYFCEIACENEQNTKILFPCRVDVMKRLIPVMMRLHYVSLWLEVLVIAAVQLQKNCLAMSPMSSLYVIISMYRLAGVLYLGYT